MSFAAPNPSLPALPISAANSSSGFYDPHIGTVLRSLLERYGVALLGEPGRLRGLLQDDCPQAKREISVLMLALEERVPQDLMRVHSGEPVHSLSPRLAKRLTDEKSLSPQAARWAVEAWAQGLGLESLLQSHPQFVALDEPQGAVPLPLQAHGQPPQPQPHFQNQQSQPSLDQGPASALGGLSKPVRQGLMGAAVLLLALGLWFGFFAPKAQITGVDMQGPLVGDGKPHPVQVAVATRNRQVEHIDVRFVRGDMPGWPQPAWRVKVESVGAAQPLLPAGTLAYTTNKPVNATFEYTLVATDGTRSTPFEKTFTIVPPIKITGVKVPRPLQVGKDFAVAISYQKSAADIVQVERRFVGGTASPQDVATQAVPAGAGESIDYAFDAAKQPMRRTVEFVLVDAQGVRSDPYKVTLEIGSLARAGAGPATVLAVSEVKEAGQASGLGAVVGAVTGGLLCNKTVGKGSGKTVATLFCGAGGAYAGNEAEKHVRGNSRWETTVRFDDGSTRVIRHDNAPGWKAGDRVEVANGAITR